MMLNSVNVLSMCIIIAAPYVEHWSKNSATTTFLFFTRSEKDFHVHGFSCRGGTFPTAMKAKVGVTVSSEPGKLVKTWHGCNPKPKSDRQLIT